MILYTLPQALFLTAMCQGAGHSTMWLHNGRRLEGLTGEDLSCVYYELEVLGVMLSSDHPAGNSTLLKSTINLVCRDSGGYFYIYSQVLAIFEGQKEACRHFIEKLN